ncbi:tumor necrosis factor receptor superfamily member 9b isoform X2 [Silurus meridionalis]|uniref:tumor necrosis factor receptor superfamily member 9b isoform X2 n=1 Tax=Silurus meridionalis TaxID=175797 RepID=UPI001EEA91DB|nr:tumor necrosis factor receptor superfamily member 9b isoform X2 [Silurus meridionalis]
MWLLLTLTLCVSLSLGYEVKRGCDEWTFDSSNTRNSCCSRCKAGNRLVSRCGLDVTTLCEPCENGTYTVAHTATSCRVCTGCISPLRVKKQCTASADTVCECVEGFQCGDDSCSFCFQLCGEGEEPTENRGCKPCPAGTFNNQLHHHCVKWNSSCPSADQQIVAAGTAVSNIVCADIKPTEIPPKFYSNDSYPGTTVVIAIICACLVISTVMLLLCVAMHFLKDKMVKTPPEPQKTETGRRLVPEPEQCTFCFPQEESGSNSSLLMDDKPFELVV